MTLCLDKELFIEPCKVTSINSCEYEIFDSAVILEQEMLNQELLNQKLKLP